MIDKIVNDKKEFNSINDINEKLNHYRELSNFGLENLSGVDYENLVTDVRRFFNMRGLLHSDTWPDVLIRITINNQIPGNNKTRLEKVSNLLGPPAGKSRMNRCNYEGEDASYFTFNYLTALWETRPQKKDLITVSAWKLKPGKTLNICNVFHHGDIIKVNGDYKKSSEAFAADMEKVKQQDHNRYLVLDALEKFLTEEFIKRVPENKLKEYLFSAHLSSTWFLSYPDPELNVDGILYPSVQRKYGTSNLALKRSAVLENFDLTHLAVQEVMETYYDDVDPTTDKGVLRFANTFHKETKFELDGDKIIYSHPLEILPAAVWEMLGDKKLRAYEDKELTGS